MKKLFLIPLILPIILLFSACKPVQENNGFRFVFMTDIHLQPERNAVAGFQEAIDNINGLDADMVITGGDLIMDALGQTYGRADSLYDLYIETLRELAVPVYNTMGNHEVYGWHRNSGADPAHPEYGKKMFNKRVGPLYQAFEFNGVKFFILNSVLYDSSSTYIGGIDQEQIGWIKDQLEETDSLTPIIICTHIPFLTTEAQILGGALVANQPNEVITNSKEVLELFNGHNLKLVLQGHLHFYETMHVFGIDYVTAGAVSAAWWTGPYYGTEEGFLVVDVLDGEIRWKYVDYGWESLN